MKTKTTKFTALLAWGLLLTAGFFCRAGDPPAVPATDLGPLLEPANRLASASIILPVGKYQLDKDFLLGGGDSPLETITLDGQGSEVFFKNGAGLTIGDITGKKTVRLVLKNFIFQTNDDVSKSPILTVGRCFNSVLDSVRAIGARQRPSAVRLVRPWGSTVRNCHFGYSNVGFESSSDGYDATHMTYQGNTFDHCHLAGAILSHHVAGLVSNCSFENNDSVGLAIVAGNASGTTASTNVTVQNCYLLNNARRPAFPEAAPLMAGYPLPGTSYKSSVPVMHLSLLNNYITYKVPYSARLNIFTGLVCTNNRLDGSTADILVEGIGAFTDNATWSTNRNNSDGGFVLLDKTTVGLRSLSQVFLSANGDDTADGLSADHAVRSWRTALGRLRPNGTIVLAGDMTVTETLKITSPLLKIRGDTGHEVIRKKCAAAFSLPSGATLDVDKIQCVDDSPGAQGSCFFQMDGGQLILGSSTGMMPAAKDTKPANLIHCLTGGSVTIMPGFGTNISPSITCAPTALLEVRSAAGIEMKTGSK